MEGVIGGTVRSWNKKRWLIVGIRVCENERGEGKGKCLKKEERLQEGLEKGGKEKERYLISSKCGNTFERIPKPFSLSLLLDPLH